jgi:hypothetical protein
MIFRRGRAGAFRPPTEFHMLRLPLRDGNVYDQEMAESSALEERYRG